MEKKLEVLDHVPGRQYLLPLPQLPVAGSQKPLPGNYRGKVGGLGPGTWRTVSSTFTLTSWSSPRDLYQVTMEKKLEVLDLVPGRQYLPPLHQLPGAVPEVSTT